MTALCNVAVRRNGSPVQFTDGVTQYSYGPFGELIRATGPMAKLNPFRFSTKYQDDETDLLYYGYRYYNASTGRWLSRDPIEEKGGKNHYGFTANNPINYIDTDGQLTGTKCSACGEWYQGTHNCAGAPPVPDPVGFAICIRDVNPVGLLENIAVIAFNIQNPQTPTDHAYLHYKHCDKCERVGFGIGGSKPGYKPKPETIFRPTDCKTCKRTEAKLEYGATEKTGTQATDNQIWDCISKVPTSKSYWPSGKNHYNCMDWAKEAASKCGLDCN